MTLFYMVQGLKFNVGWGDPGPPIPVLNSIQHSALKQGRYTVYQTTDVQRTQAVESLLNVAAVAVGKQSTLTARSDCDWAIHHIKDNLGFPDGEFDPALLRRRRDGRGRFFCLLHVEEGGSNSLTLQQSST